LHTVTLKENDRVLLCTDGLTGEVGEDEIVSILQDHADPDVACKELIEIANFYGGLIILRHSLLIGITLAQQRRETANKVEFIIVTSQQVVAKLKFMCDRIIIALDLDETLVHVTASKLNQPEDFQFGTHYVYVRPH